MARLAVACAVVLALVGCGGASHGEAAKAPGPRLTPKVARALDAGLAERVRATGVPGASAAVVFPDGREWSGAAGYAVLHPRRPMTTATTLPFDSVTKVVTASVAMRLVEQRKLSLDDPIRRWYPAWRGDPAATVRDLLGHTSGMHDPPPRFFDMPVRHAGRLMSPARFVAAAGKPGPRTTQAQYSNAGFMVAGMILQRAAGEPVATVARRELFDHPGGAGLAFQPAETPAAPHAHSYWHPDIVGRRVDANDGGPLIPSRAFAMTAGTAGALAGDVPSLARWASELLGGRILKPASLREMTRFHFGDSWDGYGLGLAKWTVVDGHLMWGHTGDGIGTHTELWYLPKKHLTVAVTTNDDVVNFDGQFLPMLVRAALGG
jgi:D-alanyl-D-alanine carboxypeptidase